MVCGVCVYFVAVCMWEKRQKGKTAYHRIHLTALAVAKVSTTAAHRTRNDLRWGKELPSELEGTWLMTEINPVKNGSYVQ